MHLLILNSNKRNPKFKFLNQTNPLKNQKFWSALILWKFLPMFPKISDKKSPKPTRNSHSPWTYQMTNSHTFCTRFFQFNLQMNLQLNTLNFVMNVSTWNKLLENQTNKETRYHFQNGLQKDLRRLLKDTDGSFWRISVKTGNLTFYQLKNQQELVLRIYLNAWSQISSNQTT